jgi:hypothetical protein
MMKLVHEGERYPTNAHKQFLLCLLIPLHVSASRCHLQGVTVSLFISYSRLSAFRVGVGYYSSGIDISNLIKRSSVQRSRLIHEITKDFVIYGHHSVSSGRNSNGITFL